jgi:hypothetical protein
MYNANKLIIIPMLQAFKVGSNIEVKKLIYGLLWMVVIRSLYHLLDTDQLNNWNQSTITWMMKFSWTNSNPTLKNNVSHLTFGA